MYMSRPVVLFIASLFTLLSTFTPGNHALGSEDDTDEVSASAPPVPPLPSIVGGVDEIAALIPQATAALVDLSVPGLSEMQTGKASYVSGKPACSEQQLTAESICREKKNPELQKTAMLINGLISGMNALNESCSTSSKVMALASTALTGYTAACGALRFRCETTCTSTGKALAQIKAGLGKGAYCKPMSPASVGNCAAIMAKYKTAETKISTGLKEEMNIADVTTVTGRTNICTHEYAALLASAGLGILSVAKTFAQTQKCDEDTKTSSASSNADATTATSADSSPSPTPVGTVPPTSMASVDYAGSYSPNEAVSSNEPTTISDAKVGLSSSAKAQDRNLASQVPADSPYRAYLPGGDKDPSKGPTVSASANNQHREITSANGKNNFEKIRESFRIQSRNLISP